jgi:signal transduction histidine kinase
LTITDDGIGFNLAEILSSAKKRKKLGLVAMEERMKMLGGSIEIWSREKQGTKITLDIPIPKEGGN